MTNKVLFCVPVHPGLVFSLLMQFFVDIVDGSWLLSWILKSDDHGTHNAHALGITVQSNLVE